MNSDGLEQIQPAVLRLESWLEYQHQPGGFGGPVAHWWSDCLDYTGPALDWRYEGILFGYLSLWRATAEAIWLSKARRAGDDLLQGQLPSGNFRNSCFELNPNTGGTPHEAACDLALLTLADVLRDLGDSAWERYSQTAQRNLENFFIARLWDPAARSFRDQPDLPSFVPNKAATLAEALFAYARLSDQTEWAEQYALPALEAILDYQVSGGLLDGAIYQNSIQGRLVEKFFPYYVARCIPGLLEGWHWSGDKRFANAARRAAAFVLRTRYPDGSFPQVLYPHGRLNRWPQWVAALGDILRALDLATQVGLEYDPGPSLHWLLGGQQADGSYATAEGFGRAYPGGRADDPRDRLGVTGWCDKAFRYLAGRLEQAALSEGNPVQIFQEAG